MKNDIKRARKLKCTSENSYVLSEYEEDWNAT